MSVRASVLIDPRRVLGRIDPRVYGQLLEHVGRAVYGGVFEPGSPLADAAGFRRDVLDACRAMAPTVLRWPGGNFASGYHWRDGIGDPSARPLRHDLAWDAYDTNAFGTEEFLDLCRRLGAEPYLALNASTGTLDEALGWLEYCNGVQPLTEVQQRQAGPHPDSHGVRLWGIGNENYGWWQHGHTSAATYAETAREWGKLLRWTDPAVEVVAVGAPDPDWNWTVLHDSIQFIDFLSLHCYWHGRSDDVYGTTLAGPVVSEAELVATWGLIQSARRARGAGHAVRIAVDEWGAWTRTIIPVGTLEADNPGAIRRAGLSARSSIDTSFEEAYDLTDALAHATWLHVMWRHPEKIGLATEAQMVNVLAPVHADPDGMFVHTIFWPMALAAKYAGPIALDAHVITDDAIAVPSAAGGSLPVVDAGATYNPESGRFHLSLVNRSRTEPVELELEGLAGEALVVTLHHDDPTAGNTRQHPDAVAPHESTADLSHGLLLPPASHTTVIVTR